MRAQAILFDKDGTLFDFHKTWSECFRGIILGNAGGDADLAGRVAQEFGYDLDTGAFDPSSIAIAGTALQAAEKVLPHFPHDTAEALADHFDAAGKDVEPVQVVPLGQFLGDLKARGLGLGVATNDSEAPTHAQLDGLGLIPYFDFIAGSDSGFGAKPDPGMCTGFADKLGIAPGQVAMIGDSLHDLHAGRAAGMQCVAVLTGVATEQDLAHAADVVLPDIGHLPKWLAG